MSIRSNAEYLRTLGGPGSGRRKDEDYERPVSSKVLRKQEERNAAVTSDLAKAASVTANKLNTVAAHQKAMGAHTDAALANEDIDNTAAVKFHTEQSNLHLDKIVGLRK